MSLLGWVEGHSPYFYRDFERYSNGEKLYYRPLSFYFLMPLRFGTEESSFCISLFMD